MDEMSRPGPETQEVSPAKRLSFFWRCFWFGPLQPGYRNFFHTAACRFLLFLPLLLFYSKTISEFDKVFCTVCWVFSGNWIKGIRTAFREPVIGFFLAFLALAAFGLTYTSGPWEVAWQRFTSYHNFLLIPMAMTLLSPFHYRACVLSIFNITILSVLFLLFTDKMFPLSDWGPWGESLHRMIASHFHNYVLIGNMTLLWVLFWIYLPFTSRFLFLECPSLPASIEAAMTLAVGGKWNGPPCGIAGIVFFRLLRWSCIAWGILYIVGFCPGRTVHLTFIVVILAGLIYHFRRKGIIFACLAGILIPSCLWMVSPMIRDRIMTGLEEGRRFNPEIPFGPWRDFHEAAGNDSVGTRLTLWTYAISEVAERPCFGYGTGSIATVYQKSLGEKKLDAPHSEYLMFLIQWGFFGLVLLLCWLYTVFRHVAFLQAPWQPLLLYVGLIVVMAAFAGEILSFGISRVLYPLFLLICADIKYERT